LIDLVFLTKAKDGDYHQEMNRFIFLNWLENQLRPKKNICVFTVTCQKNLGSVGQDYFFFLLLLSTKPEIVVPGSGI
jgi:hypothetical protein